MSYSIREMFYTLQGEGHHTGRPAIFIRFTGCNLWNGVESGRVKGTGGCAGWCDTDFVGTDGPNGGVFTRPEDVCARAETLVPPQVPRDNLLVVMTGGEPLLQLDSALVSMFRKRGFEVAIETNGTRPLPAGGVDWVCLSPKVGGKVVLERCDELKLVVPQNGFSPDDFRRFPANLRYLQPKHDERYQDNLAHTVDYCLKNPSWRLSIQTHKVVGIP